MSSNNWLSTAQSKIVNFVPNTGFISSLLDIEDNISKLSGFNVEDALDVLKKLVSKKNLDLEKALKKIGIDSTELKKLAERLSDFDEQDIEDLQLLLTNFTLLAAENQVMPAEQILPLFEGETERTHALAENIKLIINAKSQLVLAFQALASLPEGVARDANKTAILKLSLDGQLSVGSGLNIAAKGVTLGLAAQAAGSASIDFYYRHVMYRRIGDALLIDLKRLSSPFSISELKKRFHEENLAAIKLKAHHDASLSGKVGLAQEFQLSNLVSGSAGITFDFKKSLSGEFDYLIGAAGDGHLVIHLKRVAAKAKEHSSSWGLSLDMSKWAEKVYPQIQDKLGLLGELLKDFQDIVPGQNTFETILKKELTNALKDFEFKEQVLHGFGIIAGEKADLGEQVQSILHEKIESADNLWIGDIQQRSDKIKVEILENLPVATDVRNKFDEQLGKALEKGLKKLDEKLKQKLTSLVKETESFKLLIEKLNKLGHHVDESIQDIDDRINVVIGPIREQLDKLQKHLNKLKALYNDASKAKISMTLSALFHEESSDTLDLKVVLNPEAANAQAVLNDLISADLDNVFKKIENKNDAIVSVSGSFTRYAALKDENGFSIVIFGYGLSGLTSISADAKMVVDAHGNIQVLTHSEFKKLYKTLNDTRELNIADTVELASAKQSKSISLSTNLSLYDEDLTPKEAYEFFYSAEHVGLLVPGTANKAKEQLMSLNLKSGRLDVGMTLSKAQLLRLLTIDEFKDTYAKQPPVDAEEVVRVACETMADICIQNPPNSDLIPRLAMLRKELSSEVPNIGHDLASMIAAMTDKRVGLVEGKLHFIEELDDEFNTIRALSWVRARYVAIKGCHGACTKAVRDDSDPSGLLYDNPDVGDTQNEQFGLLDAIEEMRKAYFALELIGDDDTEKLVAELREQQYEIGKAFKSWFLVQGVFLKWWLLNSKEIRPLTLAFFKTIAELSKIDDEAMPMLSASLTLKGPQGENKKRIPLT